MTGYGLARGTNYSSAEYRIDPLGKGHYYEDPRNPNQYERYSSIQYARNSFNNSNNNNNNTSNNNQSLHPVSNNPYHLNSVQIQTSTQRTSSLPDLTQTRLPPPKVEENKQINNTSPNGWKFPSFTSVFKSAYSYLCQSQSQSSVGDDNDNNGTNKRRRQSMSQPPKSPLYTQQQPQPSLINPYIPKFDNLNDRPNTAPQVLTQTIPVPIHSDNGSQSTINTSIVTPPSQKRQSISTLIKENDGLINDDNNTAITISKILQRAKLSPNDAAWLKGKIDSVTNFHNIIGINNGNICATNSTQEIIQQLKFDDNMTERSRSGSIYSPQSQIQQQQYNNKYNPIPSSTLPKHRYIPHPGNYHKNRNNNNRKRTRSVAYHDDPNDKHFEEKRDRKRLRSNNQYPSHTSLRRSVERKPFRETYLKPYYYNQSHRFRIKNLTPKTKKRQKNQKLLKEFDKRNRIPTIDEDADDDDNIKKDLPKIPINGFNFVQDDNDLKGNMNGVNANINIVVPPSQKQFSFGNGDGDDNQNKNKNQNKPLKKAKKKKKNQKNQKKNGLLPHTLPNKNKNIKKIIENKNNNSNILSPIPVPVSSKQHKHTIPIPVPIDLASNTINNNSDIIEQLSQNSNENHINNNNDGDDVDVDINNNNENDENINPKTRIKDKEIENISPNRRHFGTKKVKQTKTPPLTPDNDNNDNDNDVESKTNIKPELKKKLTGLQKIMLENQKRWIEIYTIRLMRIYKQYAPNKLDNVPTLIRKFGELQGNEDKIHGLYVKVCAKYNLMPCELYDGDQFKPKPDETEKEEIKPKPKLIKKKEQKKDISIDQPQIFDNNSNNSNSNTHNDYNPWNSSQKVTTLRVPGITTSVTPNPVTTSITPSPANNNDNNNNNNNNDNSGGWSFGNNDNKQNENQSATKEKEKEKKAWNFSTNFNNNDKNDKKNKKDKKDNKQNDNNNANLATQNEPKAAATNGSFFQQPAMQFSLNNVDFGGSTFTSHDDIAENKTQNAQNAQNSNNNNKNGGFLKTNSTFSFATNTNNNNDSNKASLGKQSTLLIDDNNSINSNNNKNTGQWSFGSGNNDNNTFGTTDNNSFSFGNKGKKNNASSSSSTNNNNNNSTFQFGDNNNNDNQNKKNNNNNNSSMFGTNNNTNNNNSFSTTNNNSNNNNSNGQGSGWKFGSFSTPNPNTPFKFDATSKNNNSNINNTNNGSLFNTSTTTVNTNNNNNNNNNNTASNNFASSFQMTNNKNNNANNGNNSTSFGMANNNNNNNNNNNSGFGNSPFSWNKTQSNNPNNNNTNNNNPNNNNNNSNNPNNFGFGNSNNQNNQNNPQSNNNSLGLTNQFFSSPSQGGKRSKRPQIRARRNRGRR